MKATDIRTKTGSHNKIASNLCTDVCRFMKVVIKKYGKKIHPDLIAHLVTKEATFCCTMELLRRQVESDKN